jgi:hypothetical protein
MRRWRTEGVEAGSNLVRRFTKITAECLRRAGWHPGRTVGVQDEVSALEREGYVWTVRVLEFLAEFARLRIVHAYYGRDEGVRHDFDTDVVAAVGDICAERVFDEYAPRAGESLVVVGAACRNHLTLMMGEGGAVYGGYDGFFIRLGSDYASAFDALCNGWAGEELP